MRLLLLSFLFVYPQYAFSKVCSVLEIGPTPGFKFQKPESVAKFQTVEYESRSNAEFNLVTVGKKGEQEFFLLFNQMSPQHYPRIMVLNQNAVTIHSWNRNTDDCAECKTAARLLLFKKGRPQGSISFKDLELPFCNDIESHDSKFPICQLIPTSKAPKWQESQGVKYFRGTYQIDFQIPGSEFSYTCSTFNWREDLKINIPQGYRCEPIDGPSLTPSSKKDKALPKPLFTIAPRQLDALLRGEGFDSPVFSDVADRARLAKVYGEFCKRNHNCLSGWKPDPLLVGLKASFGFQAVCSAGEGLNIPVDFCESKDDCVWVPDCCSKFPANKNYKHPTQVCPDEVCPQDLTPPRRLECRNLQCVGVI